MFFAAQAVLLTALCIVAVGVRYARSGRRPTARGIAVDLGGIACVVLLFGVLTGFRGCASTSPLEADCQPSPHGFICNE